MDHAERTEFEALPDKAEFGLGSAKVKLERAVLESRDDVRSVMFVYRDLTTNTESTRTWSTTGVVGRYELAGDEMIRGVDQSSLLHALSFMEHMLAPDHLERIKEHLMIAAHETRDSATKVLPTD